MADFEANFVLGHQTEVNANFSVEVANNDHAILVNRDAPDQHPISAITGLQEALDEIPTDYVSDAELESALMGYATEEYVDTELESKQDALTPTQMQAVNSGATTAVVELAQSALQPNDNISELNNDAGYITGISSSDVTSALGYTPQDTLVSGTNIKTINNQSILGSGNIDIQGGSDVEAFTAAEVQTIWNGVL